MIDLYETLRAVEGTGELLTVVYHGGSFPGAQRRIVVTRVDGDLAIVKEPPDPGPKTYYFDRTELVTDDHPAPWKPEPTRAMPTDPVVRFSPWAYAIQDFHYSALGVNSRLVVDQEKTKPARDKAVLAGMDPKEATRRIKFMRSELAVSEPPAYDFHEGDVFYRRGNEKRWLQVMNVRSSEFEPILEIHAPAPRKKRRAWHITAGEFASTLFSGVLPVHRNRIRQDQSRSMTAKFWIADPLPPKMGPAVIVPTVTNTYFDRKTRATYLVVAYRKLRLREMAAEVRFHLKTSKPAKPGEKRVVVSVIGYDE